MNQPKTRNKIGELIFEGLKEDGFTDIGNSPEELSQMLSQDPALMEGVYNYVSQKNIPGMPTTVEDFAARAFGMYRPGQTKPPFTPVPGDAPASVPGVQEAMEPDMDVVEQAQRDRATERARGAMGPPPPDPSREGEDLSSRARGALVESGQLRASLSHLAGKPYSEAIMAETEDGGFMGGNPNIPLQNQGQGEAQVFTPESPLPKERSSLNEITFDQALAFSQAAGKPVDDEKLASIYEKSKSQERGAEQAREFIVGLRDPSAMPEFYRDRRGNLTNTQTDVVLGGQEMYRDPSLPPVPDFSSPIGKSKTGFPPKREEFDSVEDYVDAMQAYQYDNPLLPRASSSGDAVRAVMAQMPDAFSGRYETTDRGGYTLHSLSNFEPIQLSEAGLTKLVDDFASRIKGEPYTFAQLSEDEQKQALLDFNQAYMDDETFKKFLKENNYDPDLSKALQFINKIEVAGDNVMGDIADQASRFWTHLEIAEKYAKERASGASEEVAAKRVYPDIERLEEEIVAEKNFFERNAEAMVTNPKYANSFWLDVVPQALGSSLVFAEASMIGGPGGGGVATSALSGAFANAQSSMERAREGGATLEEQYEILNPAMAIGSFESLGGAAKIPGLSTGSQKLSGFLKLVDIRSGKNAGARIAGAIAKEGTSEGIQEVFTEVLNDANAKYYYDRTLELTSDESIAKYAQSFAGGFVAGGIFQGLGASARELAASSNNPESKRAFIGISRAIDKFIFENKTNQQSGNDQAQANQQEQPAEAGQDQKPAAQEAAANEEEAINQNQDEVQSEGNQEEVLQQQKEAGKNQEPATEGAAGNPEVVLEDSPPLGAKPEPNQSETPAEKVKKREPYSISRAVGSNAVFDRDGEPGIIYQEGQQVIFETSKEIRELGNVDEVSNLDISEFGLSPQERLDVEVDSEFGVEVRGKRYSNLYSDKMSAVNRDKDGNVVSVTLQSEDGKSRTFRGEHAQEIAYNYTLLNLEQNGTEAEIEALENAIAEAEAEQDVDRKTTRNPGEGATLTPEEQLQLAEETVLRRIEESETDKETEKTDEKVQEQGQVLEGLRADPGQEGIQQRELSEEGQQEETSEQEEAVVVPPPPAEPTLVEAEPEPGLEPESEIEVETDPEPEVPNETEFSEPEDLVEADFDSTSEAEGIYDKKGKGPEYHPSYNEDGSLKMVSRKFKSGERFFARRSDGTWVSKTRKGKQWKPVTAEGPRAFMEKLWTESSEGRKQTSAERFDPSNVGSISDAAKGEAMQALDPFGVSQQDDGSFVTPSGEPLADAEGDDITDAVFGADDKLAEAIKKLREELTAAKKRTGDYAVPDFVAAAEAKIEELEAMRSQINPDAQRVDFMARNEERVMAKEAAIQADGGVNPLTSSDEETETGEQESVKDEPKPEPEADPIPSIPGVQQHTVGILMRGGEGSSSSSGGALTAEQIQLIAEDIKRDSDQPLSSETEAFLKSSLFRSLRSRGNVFASQVHARNVNRKNHLAKPEMEKREKALNGRDGLKSRVDNLIAKISSSFNVAKKHKEVQKAMGDKGVMEKFETHLRAMIESEGMESLSSKEATEIFERYFEANYPQIKKAYDRLTQELLDGDVISGTDPATFGHASKESLAKAIASQLLLTKPKPKDGFAMHNSKSVSSRYKIQHLAKHKANVALSAMTGRASKPGAIHGSSAKSQASSAKDASILFAPESYELDLTANAGAGGRNTSLNNRVTPEPVGKPLGLTSQAIRKLAKSFKTRIFRMMPRALGARAIYDALNTTITISKGGNTRDVSHEIGHRIDDTKGAVLALEGGENQAAYEELAVIRGAMDFDERMPGRTRNQEAWAEFVRMIIEAPTQVKARFPELTSFFDSISTEAESEALQAWSDHVRALFTATGADRISAVMAGLDESGRPEKRASSWYVEAAKNQGKNATQRAMFGLLAQINVKVFDAMAPALRAFQMAAEAQGIDIWDPEDLSIAQNFQVLARNFLGFNDRFDRMLIQGMEAAPGNLAVDLNPEAKVRDKVKADSMWLRTRDGKAMPGDQALQSATNPNFYYPGVKIIDRDGDWFIIERPSLVNLDYLVAPLNNTDSETLKQSMEEVANLMINQRVIATVQAARDEASSKGLDPDGIPEMSSTSISGLAKDHAGYKSDYDYALDMVSKHEELGRTSPVKKNAIDEAARRYRLFADTTLSYMVEAGRLSPEAAKRIKDNNQQYVAMNRIMGDEPGVMDSDARSPHLNFGMTADRNMKGFKGSDREILNIYHNLLAGAKRGVMEADRNTVMRSFAMMLMGDKNRLGENRRGMYENNWREDTGINEVIRDVTIDYLRPIPRAEVEQLSQEELAQYIAQPLYNDDGSPKMENGEPVVEYYREAKAVAHEKNTIKVYQDGNWRVYSLDPSVAEVLDKMYNYRVGGAAANFFSIPAKIIHATITNMPPFVYRSFQRDTLSRLGGISTASGVKDVWSKSTKMWDLIGSASDEDLMRRFGGNLGGWHIASTGNYDRAMQAAAEKMKASGKFDSILLPGYNGIEKIQEVVRRYKRMLNWVENRNRVAEFRATRRQLEKIKDKDGNQVLSDYEIGLMAAYNARDLMDFAVGGEWAIVLNQFIPFANAAIRGIDRTFKAIHARPVYTTMAMATMAMIDLGLMALAESQGEDELRDYRDMPPYQRDLFWNFPLGNGKMMAVPKPYELGVFSSGLSRAIEATIHEDTKYLSGWHTSLLSSIVPMGGSIASILMGKIPSIYNELDANYSEFKQSRFVPSYDEGKSIYLQSSTQYGSTLAHNIGALLINVFEAAGLEKKTDKLNSRYIDGWLRGQFGYVGKHAASAYETLFGDPDSYLAYRNQWELFAGMTGFLRDRPAWNSKTVQELHKYSEYYGLQLPGYYNTALQRYFDSPSEENRKSMLDAAEAQLELWKESDAGQNAIDEAIRKMKQNGITPPNEMK